jgi:hypothetical protein
MLLHPHDSPPFSIHLRHGSRCAVLCLLKTELHRVHCAARCLRAICTTGSGFFGAISNVWRSAGGGAASSPQDTVKALQAELSTWETLAQVRGTA